MLIVRCLSDAERQHPNGGTGKLGNWQTRTLCVERLTIREKSVEVVGGGENRKNGAMPLRKGKSQKRRSSGGHLPHERPWSNINGKNIREAPR